MDSSIVATALVTIGKDFNDFVRLQWIVLSYLLIYLGKFIVPQQRPPLTVLKALL